MEDFQAIVDTCLYGVVYTTRAAIQEAGTGWDATSPRRNPTHGTLSIHRSLPPRTGRLGDTPSPRAKTGTRSRIVIYQPDSLRETNGASRLL